MDLFVALADSLGVNVPHLPLKEGMVTADAFNLINMLYLDQSPQDPANYAECQVYYNRDGRLEFEVLDKETGAVLMTFVNKSMTPISLEHAELLDNSKLMAEPLVLSKDDAYLLDNLGTGLKYPTDRPAHDDFPFILATYLNEREYIGAWNSGTYGGLCTGGLEVIYKGSGKETPEGFPKPNSPVVAIIEIHHGQQKGRICLVT